MDIRLGTTIKYYRKKKGMTHQNVADLLGMQRQSFCNWENNKREPNINMIHKLCSVFEITMEEFFRKVTEFNIIDEKY